MYCVQSLLIFALLTSVVCINFGDLCSVSDEVNSCDLKAGLACNANTDRCECEFTWMVYDVSQRLCVSPVDHHCAPDSVFDCVRGAECVEDEQRLWTCQCTEGYFTSVFSRCQGSAILGHSEGARNFKVCCPHFENIQVSELNL